MEKRRWRRMDGENKIREWKMEKRRWRREDGEEWMEKIR
ncbi:HSF_DOMAIN domain-containing protein [Psidium guajava]|nr:HSF_DOMAIN domain-containing protein [Psidium guajava]